MDSIADLFATPAARVAVVSVLAALAVQAAKALTPSLESNKVATRAVAVVVAGLLAFAADWCPDGIVTAQSYVQFFVGTLAGAELSWQWVLKALTGAQSGGARARGMGVDG